MQSDKKSLRTHGLAIGLLILAGCSDAGGPDAGGLRNGDTDPMGVRESDEALGLDFGEDWIELESTADATAATPVGTPRRAVRTGYWTVVLRTFSGENQGTAANNMVGSVGRLDPRLADAHIHATPKGSMVVYGIYDDVDDPEAQTALEWIKAIEIRDRPVFPRAMLTRIGAMGAQFRPHELMSVRRKYPRVNPLYTLQVAVWIRDESQRADDARRAAEAYVQALRSQRHEAYVHHDDAKGLSMVTVGLFDHTAIDGQSGFLAPEVETLMRSFPSHLVNGEPLMEYIDRRQPALGTRVQAPKLVLVPEG
ncbi:MAG: hypothetical protein HKO59_14735 [Phycisphaerales bacterium]|nr:hypothetical protein [Phycisphaerae bacterium]NNF43799.1 hypothetical protein [Phycisphaerales bacterium]NNM27215.1 hypothetical protein [Phycisphaerales bacterium]